MRGLRKPAAHWSYDHLDSQQKIDAECGPYSTDLDRYVPRCVPCHKKHDLGVIAERAK